MWTYDLAREQAPTIEHLRAFCNLTRDAGYNAIGLYMEHRFAYPSTPWSHGRGCVTPDMVRWLQEEFSDLQIIPFINLLGHFEGMLYTEAGHQYAEEKFKGLQACPSKPEFFELANKLVDDVLGIFTSEIIHIGGDETWQLGVCPVCLERVEEYEKTEGVDGKAQLYGEHFGVIAKRIADAGRRPAVWGDMFFDHPTALDLIPKNTLIFDWQYFKGPQETSRIFRDRGFEVVYSPALHTYNATWLHMPQSEENVREHVEAANEDGVLGVCVTTWELGLFGNYETLMPAIRASGKMLAAPPTAGVAEPASEGCKDADVARYRPLRDSPHFLKAYLEEGETTEEWARLMGTELQNAGGIFAFTGIRSSMKARLLLYSNPFLFWLHHSDELCGEVGDRALQILDHAISVAPNSAYRGVSEFGSLAIQFVRHTEDARRLYAAGLPGEAARSLVPCRQIFENLAKIAKGVHFRIGGSLADIERCHACLRHVELVIRRIKEYGDGSLGYLPSFETLTHPKFIPHDQANWWLINRWANE
jgi:hypothetical protein